MLRLSFRFLSVPKRSDLIGIYSIVQPFLIRADPGLSKPNIILVMTLNLAPLEVPLA